MNTRLFLGLVFSFVLLAGLGFSATVNDIFFTNVTGIADFGVGKNGPLFSPNFDTTNFVFQLFDFGSATNIRCVIYNVTNTNTNPSVVGNVTVTSSGTNRTCDFGSMILKKGDKYNLMVVNSSNANGGPVNMGYFNVANPYPINKTNVAFINGTYYMNGNVVTLYTANVMSTIRNVTSTTWPISNNYFALTAKDIWTNGDINTFNATIYFKNQSTFYNWTFSTTNGTVITNITNNNPDLLNITINTQDYFEQSFTNYNSSANLQVNLTQLTAQFTPKEIFTNTTLTNGNITVTDGIISVTANQNAVFNLSAGTYTVTYSKAGYYNQSQIYTLSALSSNTLDLENVTNLRLFVEVKSLYDNQLLSGFTINLFNSSFVNQSVIIGQNYTFNITNSLSYIVSAEKINFFTNQSLVSTSQNTFNLTIFVYADNQILFYFFDEDTLLPVNNVTWQLFSSTFGANGTTGASSNFLNLSGLPIESYELRYDSLNHTIRSHFVNIPLSSIIQTNTSLYLLKDERATQMVVFTTDKYNSPQSNVIVSLLRKYVINNETQYLIVEMMEPSLALQGAAPFSGVSTTIPYLFRVQRKSDGFVLFQGSAYTQNNLQTQYLIDLVYYLKISTIANPFAASQELKGLQYVMTKTNTSFSVSYAAASNLVSENCLVVIKDYSSIVGQSCSSQGDAVLTVSYTPINGSLYVANYIVNSTEDSKKYLIAFETQKIADTVIVWGYLGVFLFIMTLIITAIAFADRPSVMMIIIGAEFTVFTLASLGTFIGLQSGTLVVVSGTMLIVSIILAVLVKE